MTTEQTNESNGAPKKPRKGSKVAKRIAELEADYAVAVAGGSLDESTRLRCAIMRLENGESEESPPVEAVDVAATADAAKPSWSADVAAVAATAEPEWTWETSEEVIEVDLTDHDRAQMLRANAADEEAKAVVDRELDDAKATAKEKKAESETIAARLKDRNRQGGKETWPKKAQWKVGTCFALNTLVYVDPDTGVEVSRRPLTQRERQLELGVDKALDLLKPTEAAQMSLGDVEPTDATDVTSPESLLAAAQQGEAVEDEAGQDSGAVLVDWSKKSGWGGKALDYVKLKELVE